MKLNNLMWGVAAASLSLGLGACGKKSTDAGTSSDVAISGTLSTSSLSVMSSDFHPESVDLSTFTMSCVTFKVPPTAGTGSIGSDGSFSVTIPSAKNSKFGCFILDASEDVVASMVFEDTSSKDINGDSKSESSVSLSGNASLGTVTLDLASGKATVDKSAIASSISTTTTTGGDWSATGNWKFASYGSTLPKGYSDICAAGADHDTCSGPQIDMTIYLRQVDGKKYANGAATSDVARGLMIWESEAAFTSCGSTIGSTNAEMQANGVDFSGDTATNKTAFAWATTLTGSDTLTEGWKSSAATASHDIQMGCTPYEYQGDRAWRCYDGTNYTLDFGGGCVVTSTNTPIQIDNWSGMSCGSPSSVTAKHTGFQASEMSCSYTPQGGSATTITCSNERAVSASADFATINNSLPFDFNNVAKINSGTSCSAISSATEESKIAKLKCYSDYFYQHKDSASGCVPELRTNWSATTAAEFVEGDDQKPGSLFEANFYDIDANGVGTFTSDREDYRGVQAGENGYTNCRVREALNITIIPTDKSGTTVNNAQMEFSTESSLIDVSNPACVAYFKDQGGTKKDLGNGVYVYVTRFKSLSKIARQ